MLTESTRPYAKVAGRRTYLYQPRRGHYGIATEVPSAHRLRIALDELALTI